MSYDVDINIPVEDEHLHRVSDCREMFDDGKMYAMIFDCGNMTSNIGGMYRKALNGFGLPDFHGMTCEDALPKLIQCVEAMESSPDDYIPLEPDNGWGSYEGALSYIKDILSAVIKSPKNSRIYVSY